MICRNTIVLIWIVLFCSIWDVSIANANDSTSSSTTTSMNDDDDTTEQSQSCGLYLAVSSISTTDHSRWGIYIGDTPIHGISSIIGSMEIGIMIPHLRIYNINNTKNNYIIHDSELKMIDYLESFLWVPSTAGAKYDISHGRSIAAIPGGGLLASYSKKMTNTDWHIVLPYRHRKLGFYNTSSHPNRGAISPYDHCQMIWCSKTLKK